MGSAAKAVAFGLEPLARLESAGPGMGRIQRPGPVLFPQESEAR